MRQNYDSNPPSRMSSFPLPMRIVVYPSEHTRGHLIAHLLEVDLVGEDTTLEGAVLELLGNLSAQIAACEENEARLYFPAPLSVSDKYLYAKVRGTKIPDEMMERITRRLTGNEQIETIVATKQVREDSLLAKT